MKILNIVWKLLLVLGILLIALGYLIKHKKSFINYFKNQKRKISFSKKTNCSQKFKGTQIKEIKKNKTWIVAIDGSNGYQNIKLGHKTILLKPYEIVKIEFLGGKLKDEEGNYYYNPWPNHDYSFVKEYLGESVRYKIPNAGDNVLIIIRYKNKERVYKIENKIIFIKNPFPYFARLYFFYNGKEKFLDKKGNLQDGFKQIKCNNKMFFAIYKLK